MSGNISRFLAGMSAGHRRKYLAVGITVILIALLVGWRIHQKSAGPGKGRPGGPRRSVAVVLQPVKKGSIRDVRVFTGSVLPKSQFVAAPKVGGRLERLKVDIGDTVRSGDLIAELDGMEYDQQVRQAKAELDVAKANVTDAKSALDIAQSELERVLELRKQQVASVSEKERAEAGFQAAQAKHEVAIAQVAQREAALRANEVRLSYTQIKVSWEDGGQERVVGERYVDEGAMLSPNQPIVSILDIGTVVAAIYVIERDYPMVKIGQAAEIETDAFPGRKFSGRITKKAPLLVESSRQARVDIEVENADRLLVPGMFARARIEFAAHDDATIVPTSAIVNRDGKRGVFAADRENGKARFVPVSAGITDGDYTEIIDPALSGEVVTLGQHLLEDGAAILLPGSGGAADGAGAGRDGAKDGGAR